MTRLPGIDLGVELVETRLDTCGDARVDGRFGIDLEGGRRRRRSPSARGFRLRSEA
jgi:hypothetical protein